MKESRDKILNLSEYKWYKKVNLLVVCQPPECFLLPSTVLDCVHLSEHRDRTCCWCENTLHITSIGLFLLFSFYPLWKQIFASAASEGLSCFTVLSFHLQIPPSGAHSFLNKSIPLLSIQPQEAQKRSTHLICDLSKTDILSCWKQVTYRTTAWRTIVSMANCKACQHLLS